MICIREQSMFISSRVALCSGIRSSIIGVYVSYRILLKFSIFPRTAVRLICFFSSLGRSNQMVRIISLHSIRTSVAVMSVHRSEAWVCPLASSRSVSLMFNGYLVSNSPSRMPGLGPWASHVRMSSMQSSYQIIRRTCVSMGPSPYAVPSLWRPMHSARRMAVPTRAEWALDIWSRQSGIIYMTKDWIVSTLVVLRTLARLRAVSVPCWKFSTSSFLGTAKSRQIRSSGMLTTAENMAANIRDCMDPIGSIPPRTSFQNVSYRFSNVGRWTTLQIGCTAYQYCWMSRSAAL